MMQELWDRLDPGFAAPVWLLVGIGAMLAVALLEFGAHRRRAQAVRIFAASHLASVLTASVSPMKRMIKAVILISAVGLLFVAMARPHLFFDWQEEDRSGVDILIAVDCSKSMLTQDVKPTRLGRAKLAIADFADRLPDNRLGLIAFAGDAFLQCPLTLDHDAFQNAVQELDTDTIPRPGTDMATAVDAAVDALKSQPNNMKFLILVTDGEDLEGRVIDTVKNAAQSGLKIYTVGVGTPEGDHIVERDEIGNTQYHQDANGQQVISKLDEGTLRQIAEITGGAYVPLGQDGQGLDEVYNRYIAPLPKANLEERREKIHIEQFEWPLTAATFLLMLHFMIKDRATVPVTTSVGRPSPHRRRARHSAGAASLIAFSFLVLPSRAGDADTAERDYQSGKYEDSAQHYEKAIEGAPARNDLQFNRGDAAYKAGDFSEAEEAYRKALETPDLGLQEDTYYNLGNALFQHGEAMQKVDSKKTIKLWEQALHSYDSALKLKTNSDTTHNYSFVKQRLEELKKQASQGGQDKNDPSDGDKGNEGGDSSQQKNGGTPQNPSGKGDSGQDPTQAQQGGKNSQQANAKNPNLKTYSGTREQDSKDPNIKSKADAENLLDSLKDDERHINARSLNGDNQVPPPPSGKDW